MNAQDAKQINVIAAAKNIGESLVVMGQCFRDVAKSLDVLLSIQNVCLMPDEPMPERIETDKAVALDAPKNVEEAQPIEQVETEQEAEKPERKDEKTANEAEKSELSEQEAEKAEQPTVSLSDIRPICVALSKKGFKDKVAEAISEYGHASQLSKVDAKYYPALLKAVKAIEARS